MPPDVLSFADALRRAHVLDAPQLNELTRQVQPRFPEVRALAGELIKRNWLTPYQANQLLQGRGHELLLGSYVLLERVGEGGMGQVFTARNWKLGKIVALKLIRKERVDNPDAVRRFHREIRAAAQLDHPNIVRALDADEVNGTHLLVMEYVQGTDLAKLVKKNGPLPPDKACDACRRAALGLQHASERGLVHRDIKPHNLLLTPNGIVKILDMGLARLDRAREEDEASSTMTREGTVMGTLDFIAPEQAMDSHSVDIRADLYSLGCTLYYLLTGRVPFPGGAAMEKLMRHQTKAPEPVERLRPGVPSAVVTVVRKLMAKRPEERCQTPAEAASALSSASASGGRKPPDVQPAARRGTNATGWSSLDTPTGTANTVAAPRRKAAWRPSRWVLMGMAASVGMLALGFAVIVLTLPRPASPSAVIAKTPGQESPAQPQDTAEAAFEKWCKEVAALPAEKQGDAVGAELKRRNPDFDGKVKATVENGVVTRLELKNDHVTDITPVRALPGLKLLSCCGTEFNKKGCLTDLSPLKGMPLNELYCCDTAVADLSPLKGLSLIRLLCDRTSVSDLSPLKEMPLIGLEVGDTKITELSSLKDMRLRDLRCDYNNVSDLSPLREMPLTFLACGYSRVSDLSPLEGMKLTRLECDRARIKNISVLMNMPLKVLRCDFDPKRDAEILRAIPTLEQINGQSVADFWKAQGLTPP